MKTEDIGRLFFGRIGSQKNAIRVINLAAALFFVPIALLLLAYLAVSFQRPNPAALIDGLIPLFVWLAVPAWLAKTRSPRAALVLAFAAGVPIMLSASVAILCLVKGPAIGALAALPVLLITCAMLGLALRARLAARLLQAVAARSTNHDGSLAGS